MYATLPIQTVVLDTEGETRLVPTKEAILESGVESGNEFVVYKDGRKQLFNQEDHSTVIDYSLVHQHSHGVKREIRYSDGSKRLITTDGIEWVYDQEGKLLAYDEGHELVYV